MKKIVVLGAGMVGSAIALDLAGKYNVTSVDLNEASFHRISASSGITTVAADLSDSETVKNIVKDYDLVVGAVPGFMGFKTVKSVIEAGKNIVDISFFPEDAMQLDSIAKEKGVTAVVDFGVAPGMSNFLAGYHHYKMKLKTFKCYVGGLPAERRLPWQYKAPFSPIDVIEEYTRPARYVESGEVIEKPALTDREYLDFDSIGTLEAFNTDGLRSVIETINAPNMIEKTLRYPGHIDIIQTLKSCGFFNSDPVKVGNQEVSPLEFTSQLLINSWKLEQSDDEFTVMRIICEGEEDNQSVRYTYDLLDRRDKTTGISSMSRTTGYACTSVVNFLLDNNISKHGINPPELLADVSGMYEYILGYQKERGIVYNMKSETI